MANVVYNEYKDAMIKGTAAFTNGTSDFGVLLTTSAYSPTEGDTFATTSAFECTDGDYARKDLTGVTVSEVTVGGDATGTDDYYKVDADDAAFGPSVTISAAGAVIFKKNPDLATPGTIVTFVDFSGTKSSSNGDFTVVWNANGILNYKQGS